MDSLQAGTKARWYGLILYKRKKTFQKLFRVNNFFWLIDLIFATQTILK